MAVLRSPHSAIISVQFLFALCATVHAACFLPNGTDINKLRSPDSDSWEACDLIGQSMCCRVKGTQNVDKCQANGLCHNDVAPNLWRESCTDPTWKAPACLQLCVDKKAVNAGNPNFPDGTPLFDSHVPLTKCSDGSFCCGADAFSCCTAGKGVYIQSGTVVSTKPTATATPTGTTAGNTSGSSGSSNIGAIVGGTLGGFAGGVLIVAGLLWAWRRKKRQQANSALAATPTPTAAKTEQPWRWRHESTQPNAVSELPGSSVPELGSGRSGAQPMHGELFEAAGSDKFASSPNTQSPGQTPVSFYDRASIPERHGVPTHQNL